MSKHQHLAIEAVENGWIVRPVDCCAYGTRGPIWVYAHLHDLQIDLPRLLARPAEWNVPPPQELVSLPHDS